MTGTYIDVRGPNPILFIGMHVYELRELTRTVTVRQAIEFLEKNGRLQ